MKKHIELVVGEVLDEETLFHIKEISQICHIPTELIIEMVEYGLLDPQGNEVDEWQFTAVTVKRINTAKRLQQDLEVNLPGAAIIVEMLEELDQLRRRIRQLERNGH